MAEELLPQYERIALDVASRIAADEYQEGRKLPGRTLLSSEYHVSPETVRKAMALLADMRAVEIREKSGAVVISRDNARRYIELSRNRYHERNLREELKKVMRDIADNGRLMGELCEQLLDMKPSPLPYEKCLPNYEIRVNVHSDKIGMSIGELRFWQATGATIIAISRGSNMILSPGPYAEIYEGDVIIFVGDRGCQGAVETFINGS